MLTIEKAQRILAEFEGLTYQEAMTMMDKIRAEYDYSCSKVVFTQENAQNAAELVANWQGWNVPQRVSMSAQTTMSL